MIILRILATSLIQSLLKGWENTLFELRSERVRGVHIVFLLSLFLICPTFIVVQNPGQGVGAAGWNSNQFIMGVWPCSILKRHICYPVPDKVDENRYPAPD